MAARGEESYDAEARRLATYAQYFIMNQPVHQQILNRGLAKDGTSFLETRNTEFLVAVLAAYHISCEHREYIVQLLMTRERLPRRDIAALIFRLHIEAEDE